MNVLVTGSEGYIGKILVEMLMEKGFDVTGLDARYYTDQESSHYKLIKKDVRKVSSEDLEFQDAVIHLAALSNDPMGSLNPGITLDINKDASVRLAKLCEKKQLERFIFSSSCSVYGYTEGFAFETSALDPKTEYAKSKVESEQEISKLARKGFSPVFLRNATAFGWSPAMRIDLVVNNFVAHALATGKIKILSDGTPWRPIVHARDMAQAFIACLEEPEEHIHNKIFNVGLTSENYRVIDIAKEVAKQTGAEIEILGKGDKDSRDYRVNFDKIKNEVKSFKPQWNLKKGVAELKEKLADIEEKDLGSEKFIRIKSLQKLMQDHKVDDNLEKIVK